jgi:hypothetical protein
VDIEVRRQKRQKLLLELVERKIRLRAQELYEARGRAEGAALNDWVTAESQILGESILAPLYWRSRSKDETPKENSPAGKSSATESYV